MDWTDFFVDGSDGGKIACSELGDDNDRPIVVLGHGIGSDRFNETNKALAPLLVDNGLHVISYDASGHGQSSGAFGKVNQFDVAQNIVDVVTAKASGRRIGLFGNSYSGGASVLAAPTVGASCVGLKAPCVDWESAVINAYGQDAVRMWEQQGVVVGITPDPMYFSSVEAMRQVDLFARFDELDMPVCVWQGGGDDVIPAEDWQRLKDLSQEHGREFVLYEGADHVLSGPFFDRFIEDASAFFCSHMLS